MEREFDLRDLFNVLKQGRQFILLMTLLFALAGSAISYFFLTPVYQGRTDLLINHTVTNQDGRILSLGEIETNLKLIESYQFIIQSQRILDKASESLKGEYESSELKKKMEVKTNGNSQIISIIVEDSSLAEAAHISKTIAEAFQSEIRQLINLDNVHILSVTDPKDRAQPVRPKTFLNGLICFLIGLITSTGFIMIKHYFYGKIDSQRDISEHLLLSPLGEVPFISNSSADEGTFYNERYFKMVPKMEENSPIIEAYRLIRTNIQFQRGAKELRSIMFTSSLPEEGKSITCGNLAILMAMDHKKTVFVDCDLRKPSGHYMFHMTNRKGVTSYLTGRAQLNQIIRKTNIPNLSFIAAGPIPLHSPELLASKLMDQFIDELTKIFDLVILDAPPMVVSDPAILAAKADGCIFVISAKKNRREVIKQRIDQLKRIEANILGVILNKSDKKSIWKNYYYD